MDKIRTYSLKTETEMMKLLYRNYTEMINAGTLYIEAEKIKNCIEIDIEMM